MADSVIERLRRWPRPRTHEEKVEQAIDRLMTIEMFIYWYIAELEDLKAQLNMDPVLRRLVPIVEKMISQLWQLMRRWIAVKTNLIKAVREGLMRMERVIEDDGFWIEVIYHKNVIDMLITLHGGGGDPVEVPDLGIDREVLRAMRIGWKASDSSDVNDKYPTMGTAFAWQVIAWLITMPGSIANIYAQSISISLDGVKPVWNLRVNGFEVEWLSDIDAYREMIKLPKELFILSVFYAMLGDGTSDADDGARRIRLDNDDRGALEAVKARLEREFKISSPISPGKNVWSYAITGPNAKTITEIAVKVMEELAPAVKRLYDLMASERYVLIHFRKWVAINRASRYVYNESKVKFANMVWSSHFMDGAIDLKIETKDAEYAERIRREMEARGIDVAITKHVHKRYNEYYKVKVSWSELKKYLCSNPELREQLIEVAKRAVKNCHMWNMAHPDKKKNCNKILAAQWLKKLQDPQWLRENIGCPDS